MGLDTEHNGEGASNSLDAVALANSLASANERLQQQNRELVERLRQLEIQLPTNQGSSAQLNQGQQQQIAQPPEPQVNEVRNLKIPPFWRENPALWFGQVEASFALANITSDTTRFRHIITQLDPQTLPALSDLILNPPTANRYQAIKTRIMNSFAETSESKLRKLLR